MKRTPHISLTQNSALEDTYKSSSAVSYSGIIDYTTHGILSTLQTI